MILNDPIIDIIEVVVQTTSCPNIKVVLTTSGTKLYQKKPQNKRKKEYQTFNNDIYLFCSHLLKDKYKRSQKDSISTLFTFRPCFTI